MLLSKTDLHWSGLLLRTTVDAAAGAARSLVVERVLNELPCATGTARLAVPAGTPRYVRSSYPYPGGAKNGQEGVKIWIWNWMGTGFVMGFVFGVARVAAGAIYKRSARISAGGTALPIKRVATTRPSGNTKLSGRP